MIDFRILVVKEMSKEDEIKNKYPQFKYHIIEEWIEEDIASINKWLNREIGYKSNAGTNRTDCHLIDFLKKRVFTSSGQLTYITTGVILKVK